MINSSTENYMPTEELKFTPHSASKVYRQKAEQHKHIVNHHLFKALVKRALTNNTCKKFAIPIVQTYYDDILSFKARLNPITLQNFPNPPPFQ